MASDCCVGAAFSADLAGAYVHSLTVRNYCYVLRRCSLGTSAGFSGTLLLLLLLLLLMLR
jgi:hypothetical protein